MRKFFAVAMGSVVALAGFAGAAHASATVDLIWIDVSDTDTMGDPLCLRPQGIAGNGRDCPVDPRSNDAMSVSSVAVSDNITLAVILIPGPLGSIGGGVSVNYADALPTLSVIGFQSFTTTKPLWYLPQQLGS
jgi:hypothetical protein